MQHILLMDKNHIHRTLNRLAIQVWEQLGTNNELVIFGLNERGFSTAKQIFEFLKTISNQDIILHRYNVADKGQKNPIPNCTKKAVLIVDDDIFSGKTIFNALSTISIARSTPAQKPRGEAIKIVFFCLLIMTYLRDNVIKVN